jgi:DNA repair ATPase RecN
MGQSETEKNTRGSRPVPPLNQLLVEQNQLLTKLEEELESLPKKIVNIYQALGNTERMNREAWPTIEKLEKASNSVQWATEKIKDIIDNQCEEHKEEMKKIMVNFNITEGWVLLLSFLLGCAFTVIIDKIFM